MKKRKVVYSVLLILLIGFVLYVYNGFNGNPISKYYSTKALENYLKETYPNKKFRINEGIFNFKVAGYCFNVIEIGSIPAKDSTPKEYGFTVRGVLKPTVITDSIYIENLDEPLMNKLGNEAGQEIQPLLSAKVKSVISVSVGVEVLKGKYPPDTSWSKDMKLEKPISIHIYLNANGVTKENVLKDAQAIQATLNGYGYNYDRVNINGNIIGDNQYVKPGMEEIGYVKYSTGFSKNTQLKLKDIEELQK